MHPEALEGASTWRSTMTLPSDESVQPGARVYTSDGAELGVVVRVEPAVIVVKKSGLLGGEVPVPRSLVAQVEGDHVELSTTKDGLPG
jgi:hypothetical protein